MPRCTCNCRNHLVEDTSIEGLELAYLNTLVRAKEAESKVKQARRALDDVLTWALANRGREGREFVKCYTYAHGEISDFKDIRA